ncbi:MAG TPA: ATP-binding protein [Planctomycetota bacterium]|nr:ATP-binding protein [Planctomycetota bacterium]
MLDERVRERTRELEHLHQELLAAAHQAGRAEIATSVLHNIGNVLTGAFVDLDGLRRESGGDLPKRAQQLAELLKGERDLSRFIAEDRRGRDLPRFLQLFLDELIAADARDGVRTERLSTALGLVRDTLAVQQTYANARAFVQPLDLAHEVEQMLLLHSGALEKRSVRVVRRFDAIPVVEADRSKVGHVIANLLKNAVESLDQMPVGGRELHLDLRRAFDGTVELAVRDTGAGIAAEVQERLFAYGYTTKPEGHGFGLHWCANAMKEMGGAIRAESAGPGHGATITLTFPVGGTR